MANSDKNIVITPNVGASADDPKIVFSGADSATGPQNITLKAYPTSNGTVSFEGSAGQLFSITNDLTGTIFSVNDVSGIPSIEVNADGTVKIAEYSGNVLIGTDTDNGTDKLQVVGDALVTGDISVTGTVDGRDVAADGTKLDGIESGATGDQTASEILTAVKTVDGTGSGLDADLLDGNEASAFATSAQGSLADSATQPGDNVSTLTNDSGYLIGNQTITL